MPGIGGEIGIGLLLSMAMLDLGTTTCQYNTKNRQSDLFKEDLSPSI
jgi:hypothetical protein